MVQLSILLFVFWLVLSGKFDAFHMTLGALSAVGVAWSTHRLGLLAEPVAGLHAGTWTRWPFYLPWLIWQIFDSALQVAYVVLHPKMPINPRLIRFKCDLPNVVAHLTLANSITLTPGTVTLNVEGDEYTVHALTPAAGDALTPPKGEGEMQRRVATLFEKSRDIL
ncbi:Na+/H+ antiporter subunit E [Elusimicrobiota bacterium]